MYPEGPRISRLQQWALRLNRRQTRALIFAIAVFLLIGINPPWYFVHENEFGGVKKEFAGFYSIALPPSRGGEYTMRTEARIDWITLGIIEAICIGVATGTIIGLRDKNTEANSTYGQYR